MREELSDLLAQIQRQLISSQEIGLDPPLLSTESLQYLKRGPKSESAGTSEAPPWNSLEELEQFVTSCERCKLSKARRSVVFGEGPPHARLTFVGEAPGLEEDMAGKPFVGAAGKLLTDIIRAMGLSREQVYICNVVKCHPPGNRDPEPDEIEMCIPFLRSQISLIEPAIICTLGRISAQSLIDKGFKITRDRGQWYSFMDIPLRPTYHPAYLLRYPNAKRQVWEDVQEIMKKLGLENPRRLRD